MSVTPESLALKPDDVVLIDASQFWIKSRLEIMQTSVGPVIVKALRQQRHPLRYAMLNGLAWLLNIPMIKAAPAPGGLAAQSIEVKRLQSLRAAGVQVPSVLHVAQQWFALEYINAPNLLESLQNEPSNGVRLQMWLTGAKAIGHVHARGQALSQAFARNCLWYHGQTWFIDFEDDPASVMPLQHAQARDWLAYLHSTVWTLRQHQTDWQDLINTYRQIEPIFEHALASVLATTIKRLTWLKYLPKKRERWGRDVVVLQALGEFFFRLHGKSPHDA